MSLSPEIPNNEVKKIAPPEFRIIQIADDSNLSPERALVNAAFKARAALKLWAREQGDFFNSGQDPFSGLDNKILFLSRLNSCLNRSRQLIRIEEEPSLQMILNKVIQQISQSQESVHSTELQGKLLNPAIPAMEKVGVLKDLTTIGLEELAGSVLNQYHIEPYQNITLDNINDEGIRLVLDVEMTGFLHDIRNKVSVFTMAKTVAERLSNQNSKIDIFKESLKKTVEHLEKIVIGADDLIADILLGKDLQKIDIRSIQDIIEEKLRAGLHDSDIELIFNRGEIPEDLALRWSPSFLERLFENLSSNSAKAFRDEDIQDKKIGVSFKIEEEMRGRFLVITYADNAKGFPHWMFGYEQGRSFWSSSENTGTGEGMNYHQKILAAINKGVISLANIQDLPGTKPFGFEKGAVNIITIPVSKGE